MNESHKNRPAGLSEEQEEDMIETLYQDYYRQLFYFCLELSHNPAMAEDLVQDTFMKALENTYCLSELSPAQRRSWLYRTAKNLYIDKWRRIQKEPEPQQNLFQEDDLSEIIVRILCSQLPEEQRALFWMRYLEGYNSRELGEQFKLSPATIRARLAAARKRMRKLYKELLTSEPKEEGNAEPLKQDI